MPLAKPDASQAVRGMMRHVSLYRAGDKGKRRVRVAHPGYRVRGFGGGGARAVGNGRRNQGVREVSVPAMDRAWRAARADVSSADGDDAATQSADAQSIGPWNTSRMTNPRARRCPVTSRRTSRIPKGPAVPRRGGARELGRRRLDGSIRREGVAGRLRDHPGAGQAPVVHVPANAADTASMPAIGWQVNAAKTACTRLAAHGDWLAERVAISRYAHIPVGNLGQDWCLHTADTFFARALRDSSQLLWTGPGGVPDLGGGSGDGALSGLDDTLQTTRAEVNNPGAYRCVCVELKAHHLAVCAIANAHLLNDLEQGALLGYEQNTMGSQG